MDCDIYERINKLKEEIQKKELTIKNVIVRSVLQNDSQDISEEDLFKKAVFDIVVKAEDDNMEAECEQYKEMPIFFCRCVGGKIEKNSLGEKVTKIYCMIGISWMEMDDTYLQCMINEYYKVISAWVSTLINAVGIKDGFVVSDILRTMETDIDELYDKISKNFRKHMLEIYGIDINVIIGLSGSYYEGGQCDAGVVFVLSDNLNADKDALLLKEPIKVNEQNIRKIRKMLEMGNAKRYLAACKSEDGGWSIVGLYDKDNSGKGITFRIIRHMVWYMEMAGKKTIYYKCGRYVMECEEFCKSEFRRKYEKVFGQECSENMTKVFEGTIAQEHGTIIVILEHNYVCGEVKRLMKKSTGIEIERAAFETEYIHGITSIDGAVIFDELGICYAIGVILDGGVPMKGKPERGARYNSTLGYVEACQEAGKKALAVVVSEDKTVNILYTVV